MKGDEDDPELRSRGDASKERKADEKRLAVLAAALTDLSSKDLGRLDLDDGLADAVDEARRIRSHAARARQLRVVRRELRARDSLAIAAAVDHLARAPGPSTPTALEAEGWADRFLTEGAGGVEVFLVAHAHADRQRLNGLLRNLRKAAGSKAVKARKALVTVIQALLQEAPN